MDMEPLNLNELTTEQRLEIEIHQKKKVYDRACEYRRKFQSLQKSFYNKKEVISRLEESICSIKHILDDEKKLFESIKYLLMLVDENHWRRLYNSNSIFNYLLDNYFDGVSEGDDDGARKEEFFIKCQKFYEIVDSKNGLDSGFGDET